MYSLKIFTFYGQTNSFYIKEPDLEVIKSLGLSAILEQHESIHDWFPKYIRFFSEQTFLKTSYGREHGEFEISNFKQKIREERQEKKIDGEKGQKIYIYSLWSRTRLRKEYHPILYILLVSKLIPRSIKGSKKKI